MKTEKTTAQTSVKPSEVKDFVKTHKNVKVSETKNAFGRFNVSFESETQICTEKECRDWEEKKMQNRKNEENWGMEGW